MGHVIECVQVRSLLSNLDVNSDLRDEVMNGNISAQVLGTTHSDYNTQ